MTQFTSDDISHFTDIKESRIKATGICIWSEGERRTLESARQLYLNSSNPLWQGTTAQYSRITTIARLMDKH